MSITFSASFAEAKCSSDNLRKTILVFALYDLVVYIDKESSLCSTPAPLPSRNFSLYYRVDVKPHVQVSWVALYLYPANYLHTC